MRCALVFEMGVWVWETTGTSNMNAMYVIRVKQLRLTGLGSGSGSGSALVGEMDVWTCNQGFYFRSGQLVSSTGLFFV